MYNKNKVSKLKIEDEDKRDEDWHCTVCYNMYGQLVKCKMWPIQPDE